ncbi:hypothetical protein LP090_06130 [Moraxella bovis]|uniref:hypothetical protein n=1 Tax=Moraxella bovis TaxID=476 RepID=UPI00222806E0|nr:hypothetical protein [Moraxella bovis]UYZ67443.1 hypothetical protein LP122_06470 [Moraxella bovis]UYZ69803.1 hypothetical protein LP089_06515 [Moraxella bovis]UYZ74276.1 hypothetical protein LP105_06155 [Moraxella bovis]UYZ93925.1 hypothetical protein LP121_08440 [Moraxella bovis]UZA13087.1 hypothetical protein LP102_06485 [Moraxella bovis]
MKKLSILCLALFLAACDDPNIQQTAKNLNLDQLGEIGTNLVISTVKIECQNQLNAQENSVADLVFTAEQKANICGCVSDELKGNLTAEKSQSFIKDGQVDTNALTGVVTGAIAKCTAPTASPAPTNADSTQTEPSKPKQEP